MIDALDHIVLATQSLEAAAAGYQLLLGRGDGATSFQLDNARLDLHAGDGARPEGLSALAFAVADAQKAQRLLQQRALPATATEADAPDASRQLHLAPAATHGLVAISAIARQHDTDAPPPSPLVAAEEASAVSGLDHVVIRSPNPERAVALYAGRLGLSLRLDRSAPAWGARLLFFRCGDLVIEVVHDLKAGLGDGPDRLWGLSWRIPNLAKGHARLRAAGVDVSDMRTGRRPHTCVFTVRSHTAGVPTLMIGEDVESKSHVP